MAYGTLNAGTITPGSGNTLTISETVSLTGNATLGGTANALGTVTSGNLSNTAIVYPAGHILQVESTQSDVQAATGSAYLDAFTDVSLTTRGANKILVSCNICGVYVFNVADWIRFNLTDGTTSIQTLDENYLKGIASSAGTIPSASFGFQWLSAVLSADTLYTYNVQFKNNNGSASARLGELRTLTIMEIQQ